MRRAVQVGGCPIVYAGTVHACQARLDHQLSNVLGVFMTRLG